MERITLTDNIPVLTIKAVSFPEGVMAAHNKLHALLPSSDDRAFFGLSRPENDGIIIYRAAAEQKNPGEAQKHDLETMSIKKGNYIAFVIKDYAEAIHRIGEAFDKLLSQPGFDPKGYCVEWYFNDTDVRCMIRLEK